MSASLHALLALSLAGMLLLPLFGLAARLQPAFVRGLHAEPRAAERNCYLAAACYAATFALSSAVLWLRRYRAASQAAAASAPASAPGSAAAAKPTQVQPSKKSPRARRRTTSRSASPSKSRRSAVP